MNQRAVLLKQLVMARRALNDDGEFHREEVDELAELVVDLGEWLLRQDLFRPEESPHPAQPIAFDGHGVLRFKKNHLVRFMLDFMTQHRMGLDALRSIPGFSEQDLEQLYQLIGTSISTYGEHFPHSEQLRAAEAAAEQMQTVPPSQPPQGSGS